MAHSNTAADILRAVKLRATSGRVAVLACFRGGAQLSARDILGRMMRGKKSPGVATVYRTLKELTDAGLLRRIPTNDGALFAAADGAHLPQLVCSRCGKVEEVTDPDIARYSAQVLKNRGVAADDSLLLYADCKRKECDD